VRRRGRRERQERGEEGQERRECGGERGGESPRVY